jgi:hypothetical protein
MRWQWRTPAENYRRAYTHRHTQKITIWTQKVFHERHHTLSDLLRDLFCIRKRESLSQAFACNQCCVQGSFYTKYQYDNGTHCLSLLWVRKLCRQRPGYVMCKRNSLPPAWRSFSLPWRRHVWNLTCLLIKTASLRPGSNSNGVSIWFHSRSRHFKPRPNTV